MIGEGAVTGRGSSRASLREIRVTEVRLDGEVLDALGRAEEVRVETSRDASSPRHETVIWVVVVDGDAFVRSVRGGKGRWYREASDRKVQLPAAVLPGPRCGRFG